MSLNDYYKVTIIVIIKITSLNLANFLRYEYHQNTQTINNFQVRFPNWSNRGWTRDLSIQLHSANYWAIEVVK